MSNLKDEVLSTELNLIASIFRDALNNSDHALRNELSDGILTIYNPGGLAALAKRVIDTTGIWVNTVLENITLLHKVDYRAQWEEDHKILVNMVPKTLWRHKNGDLYELRGVTNMLATPDRYDEYPMMVVYKRIKDKSIHSRPLSRWPGSFTLEPLATDKPIKKAAAKSSTPWVE